RIKRISPRYIAVACLANAQPYFGVGNPRNLIHEAFLIDTPSECTRGKIAKTIAFAKPAGAVGTHRHGEQIPVVEIVVDPAEIGCQLIHVSIGSHGGSFRFAGPNTIGQKRIGCKPIITQVESVASHRLPFIAEQCIYTMSQAYRLPVT